MRFGALLKYIARACAPLTVLLPIFAVISLMPKAEGEAVDTFLSYLPMIFAAVLSVIVRVAYSVGITVDLLLRKRDEIVTARLHLVLRLFTAPLIFIGALMLCGPMFLGPWGIGLLFVSVFLLVPAVLIPLPHTVASAVLLWRSGRLSAVIAVLMVLSAPLAVTGTVMSILALALLKPPAPSTAEQAMPSADPQ